MDLTILIPRLQSFEGCEPHMYRCTGGKVTIGIGHAIETPADAVALSWTIDGRRAANPEIQTDWASIAAAQMDLAAPAYAHLTQCRMAPADITALVAADVASFEAKLAAALPNWSTYPEPVQEALFDMGFNLGVDGLLKFHMLLAAVDAGQWAEAAAQSHRKGIGDTRNRQTAALFLQAAG
jgi:GH24 family phage-related lysozyme (muramidase)